MDYRSSFFAELIGDGRPMLRLQALCLMLAAGFAIFQSATGHFLPQDVQYLGMTSDALCGMNQCRIVHFMFHDRVSFGGALIAIGILYLWLAEFPLRADESWAWWLFLVSGVTGFGSFLAYLGYGYLDFLRLVRTPFPQFVGSGYHRLQLRIHLRDRRSSHHRLHRFQPSAASLFRRYPVHRGRRAISSAHVVRVIGASGRTLRLKKTAESL